jgi:hypothetical protein
MAECCVPANDPAIVRASTAGVANVAINMEFERITMRQSREFDLLDAADAAYRYARLLVYDVVPIGVRLDQANLTMPQSLALVVLAGIELELASHRRDLPELISA